MDKTPPPEAGDQANGAPAAEILKPRTDEGAIPTGTTPSTTLPAASEEGKKLRRRTYRPSHKATFIALGVVAAILAVNGVVLGFVLKGKTKTNDQTGQVTISESVLSKVGVNKSTIGNSGVQLTIDPDTQFNGKLKTAGDVSIGGQLKLNSKFTAGDAALAQLEAGKTSLSDLNVSGSSTLSDLNLRNGLNVIGATRLQGPVTLSELLTVNNNTNVLGNLSVGGTFTAANFSSNSLTSTSTLTIGGHIITSGTNPGLTSGGSGVLGSNGTVSINGNDSAGRINFAVGVGAAASGALANITFKTAYTTTPRVAVTFVQVSGSTPPLCMFYLTNLGTTGFSVAQVCNSGLPIGGYAIDYIAEQ